MLETKATYRFNGIILDKDNAGDEIWGVQFKVKVKPGIKLRCSEAVNKDLFVLIHHDSIKFTNCTVFNDCDGILTVFGFSNAIFFIEEMCEFNADSVEAINIIHAFHRSHIGSELDNEVRETEKLSIDCMRPSTHIMKDMIEVYTPKLNLLYKFEQLGINWRRGKYVEFSIGLGDEFNVIVDMIANGMIVKDMKTLAICDGDWEICKEGHRIIVYIKNPQAAKVILRQCIHNTHRVNELSTEIDRLFGKKAHELQL